MQLGRKILSRAPWTKRSKASGQFSTKRKAGPPTVFSFRRAAQPPNRASQKFIKSAFNATTEGLYRPSAHEKGTRWRGKKVEPKRWCVRRWRVGGPGRGRCSFSFSTAGVSEITDSATSIRCQLKCGMSIPNGAIRIVLVGDQIIIIDTRTHEIVAMLDVKHAGRGAKLVPKAYPAV